MTTGIAEQRGERAGEADELVSEALHRRIYGLDSEYAALLARAREASPNFAPAQWHSGRIHYLNRWTKVDELTNDEGLNKRLQRYEQARGKISPTVDGYLALANWCAANALPWQERAHLFQVLSLAPDHANARQRLGFVLVNNEWIDTQTIWEGMYDVHRRQAALIKWREPVEAIQKGMRRRGARQREAARAKLAAITDPDAVYALEQLAADSSETGTLVIEALSRIQQREASAVLMRQAVFSRWPEAREAAARQLGRRPFNHYVPQLLAEMATPIQSRIETASTRGQVLYRHVFFREAQEQHQVLVFDTRYRHVRPVMLMTPGSRSGEASAGGGDEDDDEDQDSGPSFGEVVAEDLQTTARAREQQRVLQNAWLEAMNNRICHVLRTATAQQLPSQPRAWWEWWDQQSQIVRSEAKQPRTSYRQETKTFVQPAYGEAPPMAQRPPQPRHECFAAGTLVLTACGLLEIERVQVGDLVLAKQPDSGELSFRPVLVTSIRPAEPLVKIHTMSETIEATRGHPFWIDGEGWMMARDMESGMVLHGLERGVLITDVSPGQVKQTYNLIVDGFHSYFVGFDRVLAHDNTPCRPTNCVVPGLVAGVD